MRTNIDIDDDLMTQAMAATNTKTKKSAVEASMQLAVRLKAQEGIRTLFGKVEWRGHDDDWFASDTEILNKPVTTKPKTLPLRAAASKPAIPTESR